MFNTNQCYNINIIIRLITLFTQEIQLNVIVHLFQLKEC